MPSLATLIQMTDADARVAASHARRSKRTEMLEKRLALHRLLMTLAGRPGLISELQQAGVLGK